MTVSMINAITSVEAVLGYTFTDRNCVWEALQAPGSGVSVAGNRQIPEGNKRLALKGDAAIRNVIIEDWFSTHRPRGRTLLALKELPQNFLTLNLQLLPIASSKVRSPIITYSGYATCTDYRGLST